MNEIEVKIQRHILGNIERIFMIKERIYRASSTNDVEKTVSTMQKDLI